VTSEGLSDSSKIFDQINVLIFAPGGTAHLGGMRAQYKWIS